MKNTDLAYWVPSGLRVKGKQYLMLKTSCLQSTLRGLTHIYPVELLEGVKHTAQLKGLDDKILDESKITNGKNEFSFILPVSKRTVTFKLLTHGDEVKMEQELKGLEKIGKSSATLTTRLKHTILSVDGDYDIKKVREFIDDQFLAIDSKAFRDYVKNIMPDVKLTFNYEGPDGNVVEEVPIPIGVTFFWPESGA